MQEFNEKIASSSKLNLLSSEKTLQIILNNAKYKNMIKIEMPKSISTIRRFKDLVSKTTNINAAYDSIHIYNTQGLEIEASDLEYLTDNQLLYVSTINESFNPINYFNRFDILKCLKSVKNYTDSYIAKDLIENMKVYIKKYNFSNISKNKFNLFKLQITSTL